VHYTPVAGWTNTDSFTYRVVDVHGVTAEATVQVIVTNVVLDAPNLHLSLLSPGQLTLKFDGVPGQLYRVESAGDPAGAWSLIGEFTAGENGMFEYIEAVGVGAPARFYRCATP
jgi:hypothetical protein